MDCKYIRLTKHIQYIDYNILKYFSSTPIVVFRKSRPAICCNLSLRGMKTPERSELSVANLIMIVQRNVRISTPIGAIERFWLF